MDPIADMLSQIQNAAHAGKASVKVPYSKYKMAIAEVLLRYGYVSSAEHKGQQPNKVIEMGIAYEESGTPSIKGVNRVSKSSRRVYEKCKNLEPVKRGYGHAVISTPSGVLADDDAREQGVGGEVLFQIW